MVVTETGVVCASAGKAAGTAMAESRTDASQILAERLSDKIKPPIPWGKMASDYADASPDCP